MKNKIINSTINKETGICTVTIQNKYGQFTGTAKCCPEDINEFSMYAGARYAEIRAAAAFAKERLKEEKIKLKTIQNLKKDFEHNHVSLSKEEQHFINLKLRDYTQSISDWENLYTYLSHTVKEQDEERHKVLTRTK